ncbi:MAG: ECF transporter S component [Clostridium sp.]|nr:ECF transporter S component [Acetatifactor muris]MCM1526320.1 ECF transporter S component [Bacteroides sp.]MCM1562863.1 ECF transporter S component [Clostridium sp.]
MNGLLQSVRENVVTVLEFAAVIAALFAAAVILEKLAQKKNGVKEPMLGTRKVVMVGMFAAVSAILMLFEFPVFFAPPFYELDFSELPILIGAFAFGPLAGVMMEFVKILLKLALKGTSTAFVGDLANFAVGCSFILPASAIYAFRKSKKSAIAACVTGTLVMTVFGTAFNALYLLPAFAKMFMPMEQILAAGVKANPLVREGSIVSFVVACVAPLNLLKGGVASLFTMLVYKHLSPILKGGARH